MWDNYQELPQKIVDKFQEIKNIIKVERSGIRGKKEYEETVYYISSKAEIAKEVGKKIRNHWGIENKLHWAMRESRIIITTDSDFEQIIWQQERLYRGYYFIKIYP